MPTRATDLISAYGVAPKAMPAKWVRTEAADAIAFAQMSAKRV